MAYRRRQQVGNSSTTFQDLRSTPEITSTTTTVPAEAPSLAAQAIRASSAHRDSSLSSAYGPTAPPPTSYNNNNRESYRQPPPQDSGSFEYTSMKSLNESKYGFWGVLARKAKALVEDEHEKFESSGRKKPQVVDTTTGSQIPQSYQSSERYRKAEAAPQSQKNPDTIASSLNQIGGTIKNALEEGLAIVENRTADIIQETRKLNIRRKGSGSNTQNQATDKPAQYSFPHIQADYETQLKASRDVANAMAAKAKLLLRELKTVKADLAFAKERCAQLEEENRMLRESHGKEGSPEDDDLIRLQLETLLAEKGRLAHENSVYARENRFLREIVEYHQLTMQDVVYVDEGIEEVTEVFSPSPIHPMSTSNNYSSSHASTASTSLETPSPVVPLPPPSPSKNPAIVIPEACQVVPVPPTPSPKAPSIGKGDSANR